MSVKTWIIFAPLLAAGLGLQWRAMELMPDLTNRSGWDIVFFIAVILQGLSFWVLSGDRRVSHTLGITSAPNRGALRVIFAGIITSALMLLMAIVNMVVWASQR